MPQSFTLNLSHTYNCCPEKVFKKIEDVTLFNLTGADDITFVFKEDGAFSFLFNNRGEIFGMITKIIPNEIVLINWNVVGFDNTDERDTKLELIIDKIDENKSRLTIVNSGISNKKSFDKKEKAWIEILEDLEKDF